MTVKDIKYEARKKLALNMHQAIAVYTVEFTLMITLIALIVMSCVALGVNTPAAIVMICYGVVLALIAFVGVGMANFAMVDFYLATYRCKPYNIRRLGETLARSNVTKIFLLNLQRTVVGFLLLLCLIVPGVIYLIRTAMANYLLVANPKMTAKTALSASNKVMSGKTGAYFTLCVTLVGWYLLGIISLGLGFIFILPYTNLIKAVYYKRNLQGDKIEYAVPPQPVSPPIENAPPVAPAAPVTPVVPTVSVQTPQAQQPPIMPIDTLDDDDIRDMNAAMRGIGGDDGPVTVPEVPITPVYTATHSSAPRDMQEQAAGEKPITHSIDGTSIVESERVLTTRELEAQEESQKQAIEGMYSNSHSQIKPAVDYFSPREDRNRPDDFVTRETEVADSAPVDTVIPAEAPQEISDSAFEEFLREFDSETQSEAQAVQAEEKPAKLEPRPQRDTARRTVESRAAPRAASNNAAPESSARRVPPRHSQEHNGDLSDRAERIRREREERLNKLKK